MESQITFYLERAYLEAARSFFHSNVIDHEGKDRKGNEMTPNTIWALVSMSYSMSYTAIVAYTTRQLSRYWDSGPLKEKYPQRSSFTELTKNELGDLKAALKTLCDCRGKERISSANSTLWNELIQIVERHRHFIIHPKTDQAGIQKFFKETIVDRPWQFAPRVASEVIGYFYDDLDSPRNDWLRENQEFKFPTIKVIKPPNVEIG